MSDRYKAFHRELKNQFGFRVDRIALQAGFTCPNVDGSKARGGCTYCQEASYRPSSYVPHLSITDQLRVGQEVIARRYKSQHFMAYFQHGTNTYAPVNRLRELFDEALSYPGVMGMMVSTRPDCLSQEVLDLLEEYHQRTYFWLELGGQSHRDDVNESINRAHTADDFAKAVHRAHDRGLRTCAHVILGLPGETEEDTIPKAKFFSDLPIDGLKIHNLVVFKHTMLAIHYKKGLYKPWSLEKYVHECQVFLEHSRSDITIHRLNAHGPRRLTIAPDWSINKMATMNEIHRALEVHDSWQGKQLGVPRRSLTAA